MNRWRKTPSGAEPMNPRQRQIVEAIRAGRPYREIAATFGISVGRLSHIRRKAGIKRRHG